MHVAIVSFGYPPIPHVSGSRPSSMAKELTRLGHTVTVVTVDWRADVARPLDDGDVTVLRYDPRPDYPAFEPRVPFTIEPPARSEATRRARTLARLVRWGPFAPWAKWSVARLIARHRARPIDVVWAIHGDDSAHEIAFRFRRATGVPWVADFKDPWDLFHVGAARRIQWLATLRRLRTAHALTETAAVQAALDRAFGRPVDVVWSGYDAELMAQAEPVRSSRAFSVVYSGSFCENHDVDAASRVLATWRARSNQPLELHVYGQLGTERLLAALRAHGVPPEVAKLHPFADRAEIFARLKGADVLLLLPQTSQRPTGGAVGLKELEYFASGTPVLCVGPLFAEVRRVASANVIETAGVDDGARALLEESAAFAEGRASKRRIAVNPPEVAAHTWREKARELEAVLAGAARAR